MFMSKEGERITQIISELCESKADFARKMGESPQTINNWISRGIGSNVLNKIISVFPEVNASWLLTGNGDMFISNLVSTSETSEQKNQYVTYLLPMGAAGGSLCGFAADGTTLESCEQIISPIQNVDFAITVYGDSMAPEYPSGSRILIKKINPSIFIDWGKAYVLDTSNGVIVKEVHESNKDGHITCHSINPDPKFSDFDVPMSEIYGMYRVLMCMSMK